MEKNTDPGCPSAVQWGGERKCCVEVGDLRAFIFLAAINGPTTIMNVLDGKSFISEYR